MAFKRANTEEMEQRAAHEMKVLRAYQFDKSNNVAFDLQIDGWITIYNMTLVALYNEADKKKKDKSKCDPVGYFVSFPQHQDDDGNWWSYAYFKIIEPEQDMIEEQIEYLLNNPEEK